MTDHRARQHGKLGLRLGLAVSLMLGVAACSTMSDIGDGVASLDPTGLIGGDDDSSSTADTPDLAGIPSAPGSTTSPDDQKAVANSLAADGSKTQYSADALRAGTEASAPPPEGAAPANQQAMLVPPPAATASAPPTADAAPSADSAPPSTDAGPAPSAMPAPPAAAPVPAAAPPSADAAPDAAAPDAAPSPVQAAAAVPVGPSSAPSAVPSGAEPAVPAVPANTPMRGGAMSAPVMSDAALGFKPSSAPPLNPSMNQWVSAPILNHYRQTASLSGMGVGNPNAAVPGGGGAMSAASVYGGVPPTATVLFPGDGTTLGAAGRAQVRSAVAAFKAQGGSGTLRVVGHASSRTANMPVEKHLELIFDKSQKRANAVAQELIHEGVPAAQVVVDAVGDSQPVYYESMPRGEDGNRRAEIFLQ